MFLARGLHKGFRLGYQARWTQLCPAKRNIPSAYEHPRVVDAYIANEHHMGRVLGQFAQAPLCALHFRAAPDCLGHSYVGTTMVRPGSLLHCDNAAILHTIHSGKSTEPLVMHLYRGLHLFSGASVSHSGPPGSASPIHPAREPAVALPRRKTTRLTI